MTAVLSVIGRLVLERVIGLSWLEYLSSLRLSALMTTTMAGLVLLATIDLPGAGITSSTLLVLQITVGILTCFGFLAFVGRSYLREVIATLRPAAPAENPPTHRLSRPAEGQSGPHPEDHGW